MTEEGGVQVVVVGAPQQLSTPTMEVVPALENGNITAESQEISGKDNEVEDNRVDMVENLPSASEDKGASPEEQQDTQQSSVSEPPTPPSKPEHTESTTTGTPPIVQEIVVESPPPPVEKSPPVSRPRNGTVTQTFSVFSPTATTHARPSVSETLASPIVAQGHKRSLTISQGNTVSVVLIQSALETIAASREAKKSAPLKEAVERALTLVRAGEGGDQPRVIFEPLRLACETGNEKLMIASLDCISKLISYSFFLDPNEVNGHPSSPPPTSPGPGADKFASESQANLRAPTLVDDVTHTITICHSEATPDPVSLQIVKALLALVLSPTLLVHQSSLLKAVRTVYNIFLMSSDPVNQTVAQGGLTQMVHHVFTRCRMVGSRTDSVDSITLSSPQDNGIGGKSRTASKRPSLTPSTPDTYPLPPLTPPSTFPEHSERLEGPKEGQEAAQDASTEEQDGQVRKPTLYVLARFPSSLCTDYIEGNPLKNKAITRNL